MYSILDILYKCGYMWMEGQTVQRNTLFQQKYYPRWRRRPLNLTMNFHMVKKKKKKRKTIFFLWLLLLSLKGGRWQVSGTIQCLYIIIILWLFLTSLSHFTPTLGILCNVSTLFYPHTSVRCPLMGKNVCVPPCPRPRWAHCEDFKKDLSYLFYVFFFLSFHDAHCWLFPIDLNRDSEKRKSSRRGKLCWEAQVLGQGLPLCWPHSRLQAQ